MGAYIRATALPGTETTSFQRSTMALLRATKQTKPGKTSLNTSLFDYLKTVFTIVPKLGQVLGFLEGFEVLKFIRIKVG